MADFTRTLVLDVGGGSTRELHDEADAAAEIAAGALRRDTLLVVYEGGRGRSVRAGTLPELLPLFEAAGAPGHVPAPADAPARLESEEAAAFASSDASPGGATAVPRTGQAAVPPTGPLPVKAPPRPLGCGVRLLVWLLAAAAAVWLLSFCAHGFTGDPAAYATRPVAVRAAPSAASRAVGELARGAEMRGVPARSAADWLRITAGADRGRHVWRGNLSLRPRPELTGDDPPRAAAEAAPLRAEPEAGAREVGRVARGEALRGVGVTRDGWTEVRLRGGGVGYLAPTR